MSGILAPGMAAYNVLHVVGCLAAAAVFTAELRHQRLRLSHGLILPIVILLFSRVAARFFYSFESGQWPQDWTFYLSFGPGGSSQLSGLYPTLALVWLYARAVMHIPALLLFDMALPAAAVAIAFGRVGCLAAGCCRGILLPAGWSLPSWMAGDPHRFPAQMAEGLYALVLALVLRRVPIEPPNPGLRTGCFLLLHGAGRFVFQFARAETIDRGPLTSVQLLSLPLMLVGLMLVARAMRAPRVEPAAARVL